MKKIEHREYSKIQEIVVMLEQELKSYTTVEILAGLEIYKMQVMARTVRVQEQMKVEQMQSPVVKKANQILDAVKEKLGIKDEVNLDEEGDK